MTGSHDHTGANVPHFGFGGGAEDISTLIDQTDIFTIINTSLGLP